MCKFTKPLIILSVCSCITIGPIPPQHCLRATIHVKRDSRSGSAYYGSFPWHFHRQGPYNWREVIKLDHGADIPAKMDYLNTPTAVVVSLSLCFVWLTLRKKLSPHQLPLPPGPKGLPFLGSALEIDKDEPWVTYGEWKKTYGT